MNLVTIWSTFTFWQSRNRIFEWSLWRKIGSGPLAWPTKSLDLNPSDLFLRCCIKSRVYHGGKPEAGHQLVEDRWSHLWYQKLTGIHAVATFNGTMIGSMHAVQWWAFQTCVVITLRLNCWKRFKWWY
jgi:hypothetical protein